MRIKVFTILIFISALILLFLLWALHPKIGQYSNIKLPINDKRATETISYQKENSIFFCDISQTNNMSRVHLAIAEHIL